MTTEGGEKHRRFIILTTPGVQELYAAHLAPLSEEHGFALDYVSDREQFIRTALQHSPVAGVVDMSTLIRDKKKELNAVFELRTTWPVLRAKIGSDGHGELLRMKPLLKGPLVDSLVEIAQGSSPWHCEEHTRAHMRARVETRARIKSASDEAWHRANLQNLSQAGAFAVCYADLGVGTEITLEVRDLGEPTPVEGRVVWRRDWERSRELPGLGIEFAEGGLPEALRQRLGDPELAPFPID